MKSRKTLILIVACLLIALYALTRLVNPVSAQDVVDKCSPFDSWVGGERFDYQVDVDGNWNLPSDTEIMATVTFPNSGLWKYYSASQDASYVIVFLSLEPTQPEGKRLGHHDICVYKLKGLGFSQ